MKKAYVTPTVEKVEFQYDRVVVASTGGGTNWTNYNPDENAMGCITNVGGLPKCWAKPNQ